MFLKMHKVETIEAAIAALKDQTDLIIFDTSFRVVNVRWGRQVSVNVTYAEIELIEVVPQ